VLHLYIVKIVLLGKEKTYRKKTQNVQKKIIEQFKKNAHDRRNFCEILKKYIYFGAYEMLCESLKDVCVF